MLGGADAVFLRGIKTNVVFDADAWGRPGKSQPISLSIELAPKQNLEAAGKDDDVSKTVDYGKLYKQITKVLEGTLSTEKELATSIAALLHPLSQSYDINVQLPKAVLRTNEGIQFRLANIYAPQPAGEDVNVHVLRYRIAGMRVACIIGVNAHERLRKQDLVLAIEFQDILADLATVATNCDVVTKNASTLVDGVITLVEGSAFQTVEALATAVAQMVTMDFDAHAVEVEIAKPFAIATTDAAGVRLRRTRAFFADKDFWQVKRP